MFRNYLVTALRNIGRQKLYSFINIAGLAVGLACAVFIILFIRDELSYDAWIPGSENIYRVESALYLPGRGVETYAAAPFPIGPAMQAQIPEIEAQTHLMPEPMTVDVGDRMFSERVDVVDPNFFQLLRLPFAEGDPATALAQPESIVLSRSMARKYFGDHEALGKTLILYGAHSVRVTGILRDVPHNSQLIVDLVLPNTSKADPVTPVLKTRWLDIRSYVYLRLAPGADPAAVLAKAKHILDRNLDPKEKLGLDLPGSDVLRLHLTRFRDVHLSPEAQDTMVATAPGSWSVLYGFAAIATLILSIACFNFMNLATARAMLRAREVSLRKVVGARRLQLIGQFLGESVAVALLAMVLSLAIVEILLPAYDRFLDRPIAFGYAADWPLALGILLIAVLAGLLGGLYPAFVLSGFRPAATLAANSSGQQGSSLLRAALVVLQFAISIGLGVAATVVFAQMSYARQLDLGFDRENIVVVARYQVLSESAGASFMRTLKANPAIAGVTGSAHVPFNGGAGGWLARLPGSSDGIFVQYNMIDPDFAAVYRMKLLAGRDLSLAQGLDINPASYADGIEDGHNILINAAAARRFGFGIAGAVGRTISLAPADGSFHNTIVGVLDDTKFYGLRAPVQPTIYYYNPGDLSWFSVRIKPGRTQEALSFIDRTWHRFLPTRPIVRFFLDDSFNQLLVADEQEGEIFGLFVAIAIFVACLGLFGLAAFTAERRTREIGIRKVFGARTRDIVGLLLWQFSIPVLIANVIAWPVAWYYLHHWLETYAYRISLSPLYFFAAGATALLIAWVTVSAHVLLIARANPVHALRYE